MKIDSASDDRVRNEYRILSDDEKKVMKDVKAMGQAFLDLLDTLHSQPEPIGEGEEGGFGGCLGAFDRELIIAKERIEEAVMWAVKHITR